MSDSKQWHNWIVWPVVFFGSAALLFPATAWFVFAIADASKAELIIWSIGPILAIGGWSISAYYVRRRASSGPPAAPVLPPGMLFACSVAAWWFWWAADCAMQRSDLGFGVMVLSVPFGIVSLTSFIRIFTQWKAYRARALIAFLACAAAVLLTNPVGLFARRRLFDWRYPRYIAVVEKIRTGQIPVPEGRTKLPVSTYDPDLARAVYASNSNGTVYVEFLYGLAGPPPLHSLYIYTSTGQLDTRQDWWSRKRIRENWYDVSD